MHTISVIIPIYNVEKYLKQCLDSVLESKEENLEIIAINDGSTDNSYNILKTYSDPRLKIYSKQNEGLYKTWKFGVEQAHGEYIMFVDSDDYIDSNLFTTINSYLSKESVDLIQFGYYLYYENNDIKRERIFNLEEGIYRASELSKYKTQLISKYGTVDFPGSRWSKVFLAKKFKEFLKISIDNITDYEDASVTFPYASIIDSLIIIKQPYYYYRLRSNSLSQDVNKIESSFNDCKKISCYFEEIKEHVGFTNDMLDIMYFRNFATVYERAIKAKQYKLAKEIKQDKRFNELLKKHNFKNNIKGFLLIHGWFKTYNFLHKLKKN